MHEFCQTSMLRPPRMEKDVVMEYARTKCVVWPSHAIIATPGRSQLACECYVMRRLSTAQFADRAPFLLQTTTISFSISISFHLQDQ